MADMDRIIFGDNQFFGVNHMSEAKARAQSMKFQRDEAIIQVLETAYDAGIRTFMCTTHERMAGICDYFRANRSKFPDSENPGLFEGRGTGGKFWTPEPWPR